MGRRARLQTDGFDDPVVVESFEPPQPGPGEILIEVQACGVCHRDLIDRAGRFPWIQLPITPGHELAGAVLAVGEGVTSWTVGDLVAALHRDWCGSCPACERGETSLCPSAFHVFGLLVDGGYATHVIATERAVYRLPSGIDAIDAAPLHCTAGTAFRGLSRAGTKARDRVLIVGANGGVGAAAIQVAKRLGAEVVAVTRDETHVDWLTQLGADQVVVDTGNSFHKRVGRPVDIVLDCVGSPTFNSSLRSLRMGGCVVVIGNVSEARASLNLGLVIVNGLRILGSSGATAEDMTALLALHEQNPLDLSALRHGTVALENAEAAQQAVHAGGLRGRIVLDLSR